ncbi:MAG: hypothetical protein B7Y58_10405 [Halothiobacillus sp. 35-54-62]|nr:MAG: hypothetical protein B7Y58_10405 [Halothiobacillus sp. 35-54-62]
MFCFNFRHVIQHISSTLSGISFFLRIFEQGLTGGSTRTSMLREINGVRLNAIKLSPNQLIYNA